MTPPQAAAPPPPPPAPAAEKLNPDAPELSGTWTGKGANRWRVVFEKDGKVVVYQAGTKVIEGTYDGPMNSLSAGDKTWDTLNIAARPSKTGGAGGPLGGGMSTLMITMKDGQPYELRDFGEVFETAPVKLSKK